MKKTYLLLALTAFSLSACGGSVSSSSLDYGKKYYYDSFIDEKLNSNISIDESDSLTRNAHYYECHYVFNKDGTGTYYYHYSEEKWDYTFDESYNENWYLEETKISHYTKPFKYQFVDDSSLAIISDNKDIIYANDHNQSKAETHSISITIFGVGDGMLISTTGSSAYYTAKQAKNYFNVDLES